MYFQDWEHLRSFVKHCPYITCSRHPLNTQITDQLDPILFSRKSGSSDEIRCIVVSQEPGASLRKVCASDVDIMEKKLLENCKGIDLRGKQQKQVTERGTSPVNIMIRIFGTFDLYTGPIYWTHALKCVPVKDSQIRSQWKSCASLCVNHLKAEISAISTREIAFVSIGTYALTICRHLLFGESLTPVKITSYLRELIKLPRVDYITESGKKSVILTSFLHPSNRNRILAAHDKSGRIVESELRQEAFLGDFI